MKPNPAFDEITLRWWRLTTKNATELVLRMGQFRGVTSGNQRRVALLARGQLRRLAATRRDVHRAGTVISIGHGALHE